MLSATLSVVAFSGIVGSVAQLPSLFQASVYPDPTIGRKQVNVVVINYNPSIPSEGGRRLVDVMRWNDPRELSRLLVEDVRTASGGYANYEIVEWIDVDGCPPWRSGFRYRPDDLLADIRTQQWKQGDGTSYAAVLEENGVLATLDEKDIGEVWLWGAPGMHWDEYAMFIPRRDEVLPPTDNPWFYRPYDIPDVGRTLWVMGFNYERGEGEMLESYAHRCEGILSLAIAGGVWDTSRDDPWNTFTRIDKNHPGASHVGSVHYAPNSQWDYEWNNERYVESFALDWRYYPNLRGSKAWMNCYDGWGPDIATHHKWWLGLLPKAPGSTPHGLNNWWSYIVDLDAALTAYPPRLEGR